MDNQRLARLCGALDENLRQIESALDVTIARRGAKFTVRGEQAGRAAQAIEHFYDRASGDLTLDDVQLGMIEFSKDNAGKKGEAPQLFVGLFLLDCPVPSIDTSRPCRSSTTKP